MSSEVISRIPEDRANFPIAQNPLPAIDEMGYACTVPRGTIGVALAEVSMVGTVNRYLVAWSVVRQNAPACLFGVHVLEDIEP